MDSSVLCWDILLFPWGIQIRHGEVMFRGKHNSPPAYQCSISSSMLPEIDGVRDWTKAKDWKAINCWWGWHYHKALSAGWDHKLRWAPPVFMTGERGNWGGLRSVLGSGLASIVMLAVFHSYSFYLTLLYFSSPHQASVSRCLSLCYFHLTLSLVTFVFSSSLYS